MNFEKSPLPESSTRKLSPEETLRVMTEGEDMLKGAKISGSRMETENNLMSELNKKIELYVNELRQGELMFLSRIVLDNLVKNEEFRKKYLEKLKTCADGMAEGKCWEELRKEILEKGKRALKSRNN